MIGLLGKKVGMTSVFKEDGKSVPVTILKVGPCFVLQVRTKEKDGYEAIQLGFEDKKENRSTQAEKGNFKKANISPKRYVREIRTAKVQNLEPGTKLCVDNFEAGDFVDISGISIGKGFQGVVKRWHFSGGPKSHGSMFGRVPGSIGQSSFPSRVFKGMKAPGHMGAERVTVQNLEVMEVDSENGLLIIKGSVPGPEGKLLVVRESLKRGKDKNWKVFGEKKEEPVQKKPEEKSTEETKKPQEPAEDAEREIKKEEKKEQKKEETQQAKQAKAEEKTETKKPQAKPQKPPDKSGEAKPDSKKTAEDKPDKDKSKEKHK